MSLLPLKGEEGHHLKPQITLLLGDLPNPPHKGRFPDKEQGIFLKLTDFPQCHYTRPESSFLSLIWLFPFTSSLPYLHFLLLFLLLLLPLHSPLLPHFCITNVFFVHISYHSHHLLCFSTLPHNTSANYNDVRSTQIQDVPSKGFRWWYVFIIQMQVTNKMFDMYM